MKYLNNLIFEDLMDRFKWYPKPFQLTIICQDKESIQTFCQIINSYDIEWNAIRRTEKYGIYIKQNQRIDITIYSPGIGHGRRANAIIFDGNLPMNIITEVIIPMANIEPSYNGILY